MIAVFDTAGEKHALSGYTNYRIRHKADGEDQLSFYMATDLEQYKGRTLPGSYPQIAGAAPLREHRNAAAGRCFRQLPRRAHGTLQPSGDESVIVGYTLCKSCVTASCSTAARKGSENE